MGFASVLDDLFFFEIFPTFYNNLC